MAWGPLAAGSTDTLAAVQADIGLVATVGIRAVATADTGLAAPVDIRVAVLTAAETHSGAALKAGWIFVLAVAAGAPDLGEKDAVTGRCDDSARGTILPPTPES